MGISKQALWAGVLLLTAQANAETVQFPSSRHSLTTVVSELHLKWRRSPKLLALLDASQRSWERSAVETCSGLVKKVYDHGTIEAVKEDACMSQAQLQRAALLSSTFKSTLRN